MTSWAIVNLIVFLLILVMTSKPLGIYMARVFDGERTFLTPVLRPVERGIYKITGINGDAEMGWKTYTIGMLLFNLAGMVLLYLLQRFQGVLPFNPQGFGAVESLSSFNTAASFMTNTNWQGYGGETTMSHLTQMAGLTVQNFVSAATGIAIAIALIRGFVRRSASSIGNFWADLVRCTLYILLPLSIIVSIIFIICGMPQNLLASVDAVGVAGHGQTIAMGPVASQESIKLLGTNGGGFFNSNSAHPFENPTPFNNLIEMLSIFIIPAALTATFGRMAGSFRQGWAIFGAMAILFVIGVVVTTVSEQAGNPILEDMGVDVTPTATNPGGNMEGKEVRYGITASALFAVITTGASCGAVNSMHDSYMPIGGMIPLANMALGEVIFGGVGAGLYGILVFAVVAIFIAGLMVGRTPEYLGKKIESYDVKMAMLVLLAPALSILGFSALASVTDAGLSSLWNNGPHGLSEILYAYSSGTGNNGSAFAGLGANTPFYNITVGLAMLIGRFLLIVPILAMAGSLARKKLVPATSGTFPTTGLIWVFLLAGVILIVGALTYFPAYALGPLVESSFVRNGIMFPGQ